MSMIGDIWDWLKEPDDYADKPLKAFGNQAVHILMGAGLGLLVGFLWALVPPAAWEAWQYLRRGAKKADYYQDRTFFAVGSSIAIVPFWPWAGMSLGLLLAFTLYRVTRR